MPLCLVAFMPLCLVAFLYAFVPEKNPIFVSPTSFVNIKLMIMQAWKDYQEKNKERFLDELLELLRIPSVSANSSHKEDMRKCAERVRQRMLEAGAATATVY